MRTLWERAVQWSFWRQSKQNIWTVLERHTKSSKSSASALNLLTNPDKPRDPVLLMATIGLNLDSSAVSKKTIRGYAIGIPEGPLSCSHRQACWSYPVVPQGVLHSLVAPAIVWIPYYTHRGCRLGLSFAQHWKLSVNVLKHSYSQKHTGNPALVWPLAVQENWKCMRMHPC